MAKLDDDVEIAAIQAAYEALRIVLDRAGQKRAMRYLHERLSEEERARFLAENGEVRHDPAKYALAGDLNTRYDTPDEAILDGCCADLTVMEVNGVAVVSQRFGVIVPIMIGPDDDLERDDSEVLWFATRAEAEEYLADVAPK